MHSLYHILYDKKKHFVSFCQAVQLGTGESCNVTGHCQSLLEAIEALGQAGFVGQTVEVVVQRVYSVPVPDSCPGSILKHRVPFKSSTAPPAPEKDRTRLVIDYVFFTGPQAPHSAHAVAIWQRLT